MLRSLNPARGVRWPGRPRKRTLSARRALPTAAAVLVSQVECGGRRGRRPLENRLQAANRATALLFALSTDAPGAAILMTEDGLLGPYVDIKFTPKSCLRTGVSFKSLECVFGMNPKN